jgi:integrase
MARIASFLKQYSKSSTRSSYQSGVTAFLSFIYQFNRKGKRISDDEKVQLETLADRYFIEGRDYEDDLINFSNSCKRQYAPTTGSYYITAVKEFFIFNDVELTRKQERNLKNKITRGGPISEEEDLTKETIRALLNASDLKLKTLIMFMLTSGVRLGEAITLTLNDVKIEPSGEYAIVSLKGRRKTGTGTKNVHSRTTFINKEAVELLNQWLLVREKYLKYIIDHSRGRFAVRSPKNDYRLFPFGKNNAENVIKRALTKAGLFKKDEDTGRATIHYHLFRKYFVTNLTYGGVSDKYVDFFTGHINALDRAYNKPTTEKLLEIYRKGEPFLRIFDESAVEIAKTREEMKETKDRVRDMQLEHLMTKSKIDDLKEQNRRLAQEMETLRRIIEFAEQGKD